MGTGTCSSKSISLKQGNGEKNEIELLRDILERESDNGKVLNSLGKALYKLVYNI